MEEEDCSLTLTKEAVIRVLPTNDSLLLVLQKRKECGVTYQNVLQHYKGMKTRMIADSSHMLTQSGNAKEADDGSEGTYLTFLLILAVIPVLCKDSSIY